MKHLILTKKLKNLPMSYRVYEIETTMNSVIDDVSSIEARFICQVRLILLVYVIHYCFPTEKEEKHALITIFLIHLK